MEPHPLIVGHSKQRAELAADLESGNVSHAYLFAGAPHLGKKTIAEWFARELLSDGMSHGDKTELYRQMDHLIHPDFLVLDQLWIEDVCEDPAVIAQTTNLPQQHRSKGERVMRSDVISIDDVRAIQHRFQETGTLPRRVCIIRHIERMQDAAGNAFLKMLEEPPAGRVFLLTTASLESILPTLRSRARVLRFERVGDREMRALLTDLDPEDAAFILHLSQGAPGMAMQLRADPDRLREEKTLHAHARSFWDASSLHARLRLLDPVLKRGGEADRFVFHLALALRSVPEAMPVRERALMQLLHRLQTNAHRGLLLQEFAIQCGG